jgi:hypothetical protein
MSEVPDKSTEETGHLLILTSSRQVPIHMAGQSRFYPLQGLVQMLGIHSSSHSHARSPFIRLGSLAFTHYKALFKGWALTHPHILTPGPHS